MDTSPKDYIEAKETEYIITAEYDDGVEVTLDVIAPSEKDAMAAFMAHMGPGFQIISVESGDTEETGEEVEETNETQETTATDVRTEECAKVLEGNFSETCEDAMEELC